MSRDLILIILLIMVAAFLVATFFPSEITIVNKKAQLPPPEPEIKVFLAGDIILNRGVEHYVKEESQGDWEFPFLKISSFFKKADILFGNLESVVSDKGVKVGSIYSFRAEPESVNGLRKAGFDILSLANNHSFDYGRIALEQTMEILRENDIDFVGAGNYEEAFKAKILEVEGIKVAFLAFTNLGPQEWQAGEKTGIAWIDNVDEAIREIEKVKPKTDLVIVSLHSGEEYSLEPTEFQKSFSKKCIEVGADLVVGHHSHVIQSLEKYKEGWISYSLGNFVFDQSFSKQTMEGLVLELRVKKKEFKVIPHKIKINQFFQPELVD